MKLIDVRLESKEENYQNWSLWWSLGKFGFPKQYKNKKTKKTTKHGETIPFKEKMHKKK